MSTRLWIVAAAFIVSAAGCQGSISPEPPVHLNPNMDQQNRFDPQEPNDFFDNGMSQRPFVEGTVARGQLRADDHLHRGRDANGYVNALPKVDEKGEAITLDRALMQRGQERYNIYCAPCHDLGGAGAGIVIQRALDEAKGKEGGPGFNPPPSFHDDRLLKAPLGKIYDVITNGFGVMYSYASRIPVEDRWAIAGYIRALQLSQNAEYSKLPAEDRKQLDD